MRDLYLEYMNSREYIHYISKCNMTNVFSEAVAYNEESFPIYDLPEIKMKSHIENEILRLESLELVLKEDNTKFLDAFMESAFKINPIGLSIDLLTESCIETKYKEATDYIYGKMKEAFSTNDVACVNSFTNSLVNPDKDTNNTLTCMISSKDIFNTDKDHKITRQDVKEAKEYLEKCPDKINKLKKLAKDKANSFKLKANSLRGDMDKASKEVHGKGKKQVIHGCGDPDKIKEGCENMLISQSIAVAAYTEAQDMIDLSYIVQLENQIIEKNTQARQIIAMVAHHNPRNIAESSLVTNLVSDIISESSNVIYEECDNIDIGTYIEERAFQDKITKLKAKLILSNKKFLKKYEEIALKSNCKGLILKEWYTPIDCDKKLNEVLEEIDRVLVANSDDPEELKAQYKELRGSYLCYYIDGKKSRVMSKMYDDRDSVVGSIKDAALEKHLNHQITHKDVKDAIEYLKHSDRLIDEYYNNYNKSLRTTLYNSDVAMTLGRSKDEKYIKEIDQLRRTAIDQVMNIYYHMKSIQVDVLQQQSRMVVMKAARLTKVSESELMEMKDVDILFEQLFDTISK